MRISERKLRSIIRSVIFESEEDEPLRYSRRGQRSLADFDIKNVNSNDYIIEEFSDNSSQTLKSDIKKAQEKGLIFCDEGHYQKIYGVNNDLAQNYIVFRFKEVLYTIKGLDRLQSPTKGSEMQFLSKWGFKEMTSEKISLSMERENI